MINKRYVLVLTLILIMTVITIGCGKDSGGSEQYIVTVTTKAIDSGTGKIVETATTKTVGGKQGSTSSGMTKFTLNGDKDYTFISTAPYYVESKKKVHVGKENIVVTIKLSKNKGKILGTVTDEGGNGLKGATVSLVELSKKTETDSNGKFEFLEVPINGNTYTLKIEKATYGVRNLSNIKIEPGEKQKDVGKIVLTNNPGILSGRILDSKGNTINGVTVSIVELGKSTTSDYNGEFEFEVLPGSYTLEFSHGDYQKVTRKEEVQSDKNTFVNIEMTAKPGSVSGIVLDNYGEPVSGVQASILGLNKQVETLSNGHFQLEDVPPGNYTLEFMHPQFRIYNKSANVKKGQDTNLGNIMLDEKTGMLTGRVLEKSTDNPIANANVKLKETGENINTNSDGYYTFNNLRIGDYTLQISAVSYSTAEVPNLVVKENSVTNVDNVKLIKDPAEIIGTVKDNLTDEVLENVTITLNEISLNKTSNSIGSFKFANLEAGTYSMTLTYDNYYSKTVNSIYCGPSSTTNLGTVYLDPKPVKITGISTPGATVALQGTSKSATVDGTGSFILQDISPGTYTVGITLDNYKSKTIELNTTPGQTYDLGDVSLDPIPGEIIGASNADTITIKETGQVLDNTAETFKISELQPGDYTLEFTKANYYTKQVQVSVNPNSTSDVGTVTLDPKPGKIKGYTDSGVTVELVENSNSISVTEGYFEFIDLSPGTYTIEFTKADYYSKSFTKQINPAEVIDLGTVNLEPIPGAIVGSTNADTVTIKETGESITITSGSFSFNDMQPGSYTLVLEKPDYYTKEISVDLNPNSTADIGTVDLKPKPSRLYGNTNAGVTVTLLRSGSTITSKTTTSGYFEIDISDLLPDTYTVKFTKDNYYSKEITKTVNPNEDLDIGTITLDPKPGKIAGTTNADTVYIQETNQNAYISSGNFTISDIQPGSYTVVFEKNNYQSKTTNNVEVNPNQTSNVGDVSLNPLPGKITGTIQDYYTGDVLSNVSVSLNELEKSVTTNSNGVFEITDIPVGGPYSITISYPNYYNQDKTNISIDPNETVSLGIIKLEPKSATLTGTGVQGSRVEIRETGQYDTIDSTNSFTIPNVTPGSYTVDITKNNYYSKSISVTADPGQTHDLGDLSLDPKPSYITGTTEAATINIVELSKTISHPGGTFNIEVSNPGDYTLIFSKSGYEDKNINVSLTADETKDIGSINLNPLPSKIKGYVDTSLTDVNVKLIETADGKTLANGGYFEFTNLNPNTYNIEFSKTNYKTKTITKSGVGPDEVVDLGTVTLNPLPGKIVGSTNADTVKIKQTGETQNITGDLFSYENLQTGDYTLRFTKANYYSKEVPVTVNANQTVDVGTITLQATEGTIEGYLNVTGDVVLINTGQTFNSYSGYYSFNNLQTPGDYWVKISRDGYFPIVKKISLGAGETFNIGSEAPSNKLSWYGVSEKAERNFSLENNIGIGEKVKTANLNLDYGQTVSYTGELSSYENYSSNESSFYIGAQVYHTTTSSYKQYTGTVSLSSGATTVGTDVNTYGKYARVYITYYDDVRGGLISFDKDWSSPSTSASVTINISDSLAGVNNIQYKWSTSTTKPTSGWTTISNGGVVTQNNVGEWYLHVKTVDNAGNETYKWEGPYIIK